MSERFAVAMRERALSPRARSARSGASDGVRDGRAWRDAVVVVAHGCRPRIAPGPRRNAGRARQRPASPGRIRGSRRASIEQVPAPATVGRWTSFGTITPPPCEACTPQGRIGSVTCSSTRSTHAPTQVGAHRHTLDALFRGAVCAPAHRPGMVQVDHLHSWPAGSTACHHPDRMRQREAPRPHSSPRTHPRSRRAASRCAKYIEFHAGLNRRARTSTRGGANCGYATAKSQHPGYRGARPARNAPGDHPAPRLPA